METIITLNNKKSRIPKEFQDNDNRYPESLVEYFLKKYTKKGDKMFDPFAGLGTSLIISEKFDRIPFGIEYDEKRCNYIKSKLIHKNNIINGDSLKLKKNKFPKFDFSITSPPYNQINEENYLSGKGGYNGFIKDIGKIYSQLKQFMKKNSYVVIEVTNLKGKEVTTLAWDIGKEVSKVFHFEGEIIINWKTKGTCKGEGNYGYDHSYCLVFRNK
jgi:DNA modification methylase